MLCCQKEMGKNGVSGAVGAVGEVQAAEAVGRGTAGAGYRDSRGRERV